MNYDNSFFMTDQSATDENPLKDKLILVGVISKAHGIKGQVVVRSYTSLPQNIVKLPLFDQNNLPVKLKINRVGANGNLICTLDNCHTRTMAEVHVKKALYCYRVDLPEIDVEDEFYIEDLISMTLKDNEGKNIGKVLNVVNYGAGDIIELKLNDEKESVFHPFTKELFPEVNKTYIVWAGNK